MSRPSLLVVACVMLHASALRAQPESSSVLAGEHFRRGLEHAKNAQLGLAVYEFEAAYAKSPHFSVLFNLGQAYTALGRPAEAISAFERYLQQAGPNLERARREQVQELIEVNREGAGELVVRVASPTTRVWLNGQELVAGQLGRPFTVAAGQHTLLSADGGNAPVTRVLSVAPKNLTKVDLPIAPATMGVPGQLQVTCPVPSVRVALDGQLRGSTPFSGPLIVNSGKHRVSFHRAGYAAATSDVKIEAGGLSTISCDVRPTTPLASEHRAWLRLEVQPADARVLVDGRNFVTGALPAGPHTVLIRRAGYADYQRGIDVAAGQTLTLSARLSFTPDQRRLREQVSARRTTGWVLAGVGGAFVATGISLQIYNAQRYDDWQGRKASATETENLRSVASILRVDDLSIGLLIAGAGLLASGTWLSWPRSPAPSD